MEEVPENSNFENNYVEQKKQKNLRKRLLCGLLLDFAKNTTLHGLRYVTERGLSAVENLGMGNIKIEMYFKEPQFVSMRRSELFGLTDFLANCGGLLGLFLGFSFLSIIEIFYFLTMILACTFRRDNIVKKKGKAIQMENNRTEKF